VPDKALMVQNFPENALRFCGLERGHCCPVQLTAHRAGGGGGDGSGNRDPTVDCIGGGGGKALSCGADAAAGGGGGGGAVANLAAVLVLGGAAEVFSAFAFGFTGFGTGCNAASTGLGMKVDESSTVTGTVCGT
jgi:hypothetical protein